MTMNRRRHQRPAPTTPASSFDEELVVNTIFNHGGNATARELARELGISASTLSKWMKEYPAINSAVREMRSYVDDAIESALAKRAMGYDVDYEEVIDGPKGTTTKTGTTHIPPDVGAAKFWLTNRRRDRWADRQVVEIEGGLKTALQHAAEVLNLDVAEWKDVTDADAASS